MECVRVSFAPNTDAVAARAALERAVRRVNRRELWRTLCLDFFAFAEIPVEEEPEPPQTARLPEYAEEPPEGAAAGTEDRKGAAESEIPEDTQAAETALSESVTEGAVEESEGAAEGAVEESEGAAEADMQSLTQAESPFFCVLISPAMAREALAAVADAASIPVRFAPLSPEEAEGFYREALDTCRGMPIGAAPELAAACGHLALLLSDTERKGEAESLYLEALDGWRALSARRVMGAESATAETCRNLARLLYATGRMKDAEKRYCEAMDIYRELSRRDGAYQSPLARTCQELAICLEDCGRPEAAEWFYRKALDGYRKLAGRNPAAYAPRVAAACGNLAGLLKSAGRAAEAAGLYKIALETYVRLVHDDPARWEPELAFLYESLAEFESARSPSAGKALLHSAWMLYQKYPALAAEAERVRAQIREP